LAFFVGVKFLMDGSTMILSFSTILYGVSFSPAGKGLRCQKEDSGVSDAVASMAKYKKCKTTSF
jgi:hypothetical protein